MVDDADEAPGVPRWVKALVLVALLLAAMLAVVLLSGGEHGPGRHASAVVAAGSA